MPREMLRRDPWLWALAAGTLLVHIAVAGRYDFFRDELYFIICGRHPAFGYVDQPPLVPLLSAATQLFGECLWLLRLPAALAAAALVPLTGAFARLLGGGRGAALIAGGASALAPVLIGLSATLCTSSFDALAWTALAYFVTRAALRGTDRDLIWAGLIAGVAFEAKYGVVLWFIGLAIGLAAMPERRLYARRALWYGAALAALIAAPNLIWQTVEGWPFLEVTANHSRDNLTGSPLYFFLHQIFILNPFLAPLWLAGLIAPFVRAELKPARFLAIAWLGAAIVTWASHGKDYYLAGAYPTLFAIGAVVAARAWVWLKIVVIAVAVAVTAEALPMTLPILSPDLLGDYMDATHLRPKANQRASLGAPLTQLFSDQFGWRELEQKVAAVYRALPPDERARAAIIATDYGEAAAIDFYGAADGLPPALSGQDQYYLWGTRGHDGGVIIHINGDPARWRDRCARLEIAGRFGAPYTMPYEDDRPIMLCRDFHGGLARAWPAFKRYY
ncbi:MAG TPA: glycosyltransferase family 39 protein [Stellaceae bacterium]